LKIRILFVTVLLMLFSFSLAACTQQTPNAPQALPAPDVLYQTIADAADLVPMLTLTSDELYDVIGIDPAWYTESAAYFAADGTAPDEILIFLAVDEAAAVLLENTLNTRLQYKRDSAAQYLTENQPMLENGVVRRDGLTVSLLVAVDMDAIESCYPK
jgi:hypothetical protein